MESLFIELDKEKDLFCKEIYLKIKYQYSDFESKEILNDYIISRYNITYDEYIKEDMKRLFDEISIKLFNKYKYSKSGLSFNKNVREEVSYLNLSDDEKLYILNNSNKEFLSYLKNK